MSTKMQLQWRRRQVFDLSSKGYNQTQIAKILHISESTISRDLDLLIQQSKENIKRYIEERKLASKNDEIILVVRRLGQTGNISSEGRGKGKSKKRQATS